MRVRFFALSVSVAIMLLMAATPAAAQARASTDGFGIKGGVTFTNLDLEVPTTIVTEKGQTGFTAGAFYGVRLAGPVHVDLEGLFTTKGTKFRFGDLENRMRLTYLEVPILARVGVVHSGRTTGYVSGGPSFAFKLKEVAEEDGEETARSNDAKKYDVGFAFGGGVSFGRWIVDARYTLGVTDIVDVEAQFSGPSTAKNRFFALTAGYRW
jgi:Outer membrane protein beta-barrel domain